MKKVNFNCVGPLVGIPDSDMQNTVYFFLYKIFILKDKIINDLISYHELQFLKHFGELISSKLKNKVTILNVGAENCFYWLKTNILGGKQAHNTK